jgi:hypothetical protein
VDHAANMDVQSNADNVILTPSTMSNKELTSTELEQVNDYYLMNVPQYNSLMVEYEKHLY